MAYKPAPWYGLDDRDKAFALSAVKQLRTTELFTVGVIETLKKRQAEHVDAFKSTTDAGQWANLHGRVQELADIIYLLELSDLK